jgi:hypothetical protein
MSSVEISSPKTLALLRKFYIDTYKLFTSEGSPFPATCLNSSFIISKVSSFLVLEVLVCELVVVSPPSATGLYIVKGATPPY